MSWGRLARYQGAWGSAFPSIPTLASEVGLKPTQTRTYLRELERNGFLQINRRSGTSSTYEFLWHRAFDGDAGQRRKAPPLRKTEQVAVRKTGGVASSESRVTEPSENRRRRELSEYHHQEESLFKSFEKAPSQKADKDETQKRKPSADPEEEFLLRLNERHRNLIRTEKFDPVKCIADLCVELQHVPLEEFLELDSKVTTNPGGLVNPHGYYRALARKLVMQIEEADRKRGESEKPENRFPCCKGTGEVAPGVYCSCRVGEFNKSLTNTRRSRALQREQSQDRRKPEVPGDAGTQQARWCSRHPGLIFGPGEASFGLVRRARISPRRGGRPSLCGAGSLFLGEPGPHRPRRPT